jgi:hypothetical protein
LGQEGQRKLCGVSSGSNQQGQSILTFRNPQTVGRMRPTGGIGSTVLLRFLFGNKFLTGQPNANVSREFAQPSQSGALLAQYNAGTTQAQSRGLVLKAIADNQTIGRIASQKIYSKWNRCLKLEIYSK